MNPASPPRCVLIVDDELDNLALGLAILEDHGLEVATARDGLEGLAVATRLLPDLILLDVRMPGVDGFAVCRQLKAQPATREIPVIFLSALDQIEDKAQGFAAGGVDYVTKPYMVRPALQENSPAALSGLDGFFGYLVVLLFTLCS